MITIGSLFSGIGGMELGLERGIRHARTIWQVEIDTFCTRILAKHWPHATRFQDVRSVGSANLPPVDILCGGFPCQDVSSAGAKRGLAGPKSGLWYEYRRIVAELRPRFVVVENVTSGKKLWLPTVKEDLRALGYGVRAFALSAADVGAPHLRRRVFVIAYPNSIVLREQPRGSERENGQGEALAPRDGIAGLARDPDRDGESTQSEHGEVAQLCGVASAPPHWTTPPVFRGVDDGVSGRVDRSRRLRALGNAVVPQCAEVIGRMIAEQ